MLCYSAERLTHPACHLNTESDLSTYYMCLLFKLDWKRAATLLLCASACVFVSVLSMWESLPCMLKCMHVTLPSSLSVNFDPLTQPVWWTHSSHRHVLGRQTGGGAYGCSLLKSLNIHRHGSFDPCTVELTCMTILWCGEPCRGQLWGSYVVKLWEQHALIQTVPLKWRREHVGDTWAF